MKSLIFQKLNEIEIVNKVRVLLAVESGSRAWGFASPDSDYDVRFIYIREKDDYLRLDSFSDVIELPISDELDINGWDLPKTLRLLYNSNPTLFEWLSSPIIYMETPFAEKIRKEMMNFFSVKKSIHHYLSMAQGNSHGIQKGEMVRAKKYFYVLRPVLACRWVMEKKAPPPMLFAELAEAELPSSLKEEVNKLLDLKMNFPEIKEIPKITVLNDFLDSEMANIKAKLSALDEKKENDWKKLNDLFLSALSM
jgi:predicted nucleotidyltransferase